MTEFNLLVGAADGKLPEWIRLLPLGEIKLFDGRESFNVDPASLDRMVAAFRSRGIDLVIDYEHQSLQGERAPAAGWIKNLEGRSDGLWGRVEWTAQAAEFLKNREYRYFSPVLRLDPETRKPLALMHVGLTNVPAINHLPPLVAKAEAFGDARAAQAARAKQSGIGVKEGGNLTKPKGFETTPDAQFADPTNYRYPMPDQAHCQNALARWNDTSNQAQYSEAERAIIMKHIMARHKELGMPTPQEAKAMKNKLLGLLALKAETTDDEALEALEIRLKLAGSLPEIATAAGLKSEATVNEITGAILALKDGSGQVTALRTELEALKVDSAQGKAQKAVDEARTAHKITPAQVEWALKYAAADPEGFAAYVKAAVPVLPGKELKTPAGGGGKNGLDAEQMTMCITAGIKPEAFKASRGQLIEQGLLREEG